MNVCCSHKGTMTSKSALQHRSSQSASLTDQSCCAEQSRTQIAGLCHCKFTCERLLLTQRHYDQQECTATQIMPKCMPTNQSCCADNSLTAGMFDCKFTCESLLLTQRHHDQQQCTVAHGKVHPSLIRAVVQNRVEIR